LDQVKFEDAHETKLYLRLLVHVAFRFRRPWNKLILDFIYYCLSCEPTTCYAKRLLYFTQWNRSESDFSLNDLKDITNHDRP